MSLVELNIDEEIRVAREQRFDNAKRLIKTGITYWDTATYGIWAKDLIVLTARSGAGKTQISTILAQNVAKQGKNVLFFALEAYKGEILNRSLYTELSRLVKEANSSTYINYKDFCLGKYDSQYMLLMSKAEQNIKSKNDNIRIIYRDSEIKVQDVLTEVENSYSQDQERNILDLIVIDHLHYFDFDDELEFRAVKRTVKALRTLALTQNVAILLIAHIRKKDRHNIDLVPDMDEIGGTSDIFKEATQVVSLASYQPWNKRNQYATLFKICKSRVDGSPISYLGMQHFNSESQSYEEEYTLCRQNGKKLEAIASEDMPYWAIRAVNQPSLKEVKPKQEILPYANFTETDRE